MGFQPADIGRYNDANAQQGGSWMGTLDMLRTWQKGQTKSKQRAALRSALIDSGFQQLADEHLGTCSAGKRLHCDILSEVDAFKSSLY